MLQSKSLGIVDSRLWVFEGEIRDQTRMGVTFSSDEDAMECNVLSKCSSMVAGDGKSTRVHPFGQIEASICSRATRGVQNIIFTNKGRRKVRVIYGFNSNITLSIG